MTRKKVKLAFITNDSSRKATFKKRKKGLMKKVSELSTLCGIDACAIVYNPYEPQPDVFPDMHGGHQVVSQFKRMPEMEQSKKMVNQESFIRNRIVKASEQLKKLSKDNREKEITHLMYMCLTGKGVEGMNVGELNDLGWVLERDLKEVYKRIDCLKKGSVVHAPKGKVGMELGGLQHQQHQQSWFADWARSVAGDQQGVSAAFRGHGGGVVGEKMQVTQFNDGGGNNQNNNINHNHNHNIDMTNNGDNIVGSNEGGGGSIWSSAFFP